MANQNPFESKYSKAIGDLIGRELDSRDRTRETLLIAAERRLKAKLPASLRSYYLTAGKLGLNTEHNRLYSPSKLQWMKGKLVFMEENQAVVYWGLDKRELGEEDPMVFQVANEEPYEWCPENLRFSDWIIKMWRWQRGVEPLPDIS